HFFHSPLGFQGQSNKDLVHPGATDDHLDLVDMAENLYAVEALANFMLVPREKPYDTQAQFRMLPNLLPQRLPDMLCTHNDNMAQVVASPPYHAEQFTEDEARENETHTAEAPEIDEHDPRELRLLDKIGGNHQYQGGECRGFQDIPCFAE